VCLLRKSLLCPPLAPERSGGAGGGTYTHKTAGSFSGFSVESVTEVAVILIYVVFRATRHECLSVSIISELSSRRFSELLLLTLHGEGGCTEAEGKCENLFVLFLFFILYSFM
jgi:hypothetical protein